MFRFATICKVGLALILFFVIYFLPLEGARPLDKYLKGLDGINEEYCGRRGVEVPERFKESWWDRRLHKSASSVNSRIASGWNAVEGEFPWHVVIEVRLAGRLDYCGGVIIDRSFVVTAASCIKRDFEKTLEVKVVAGVYRRNDTSTSQLLSAAKYCISDSYRNETNENPIYEPSLRNFDLALIKLDGRLKYTKSVQPACIHALFNRFESYGTKSYKNCVFAGFGVINKQETLPEVIQGLHMVRCNRKFGMGDVCFTTPERTRYPGIPCSGDLGSGLYCQAQGDRTKHYLLGLLNTLPKGSCQSEDSSGSEYEKNLKFTTFDFKFPEFSDVYKACQN